MWQGFKTGQYGFNQQAKPGNPTSGTVGPIGKVSLNQPMRPRPINDAEIPFYAGVYPRVSDPNMRRYLTR